MLAMSQTDILSFFERLVHIIFFGVGEGVGMLLRIKHLRVLIHIRNKGEAGTVKHVLARQ